MKSYHEEDLLRIAKRYNNPKRNYLMVNPLQAKHMPVQPKVSLEMMHALGEKVRSRFPQAKIIIGFAETATAIGAAVADTISQDSFYIHTTRENFTAGERIVFSEEHSHAPEQWLCLDRLKNLLSHSLQIVFVDDEISTGRTLTNIVSALRERLTEIRHIPIVAASVLSRLSLSDERALSENGIETLSLLRIDQKDYTKAVNDFSIEEAKDVPREAGSWRELRMSLDDPRKGVKIGDYKDHCKEELKIALQTADVRSLSGRILVLGTEECMYPSLLLGEMLEEAGFSVFCHATTRSPIGICKEPGYPIRNGYRLRSFYADERATYLYNLEGYDAAFLVSDGGHSAEAIKELSSLLSRYGCKKVYFLRGER